MGVALAAAAGYFFGEAEGWEALRGGFDALGGGWSGWTDGAGGAGETDLDSVLSESAKESSSIVDGVLGGLAGLANGLNRRAGGLEAELDEDVAEAAGSALDEMAGSGVSEGLELEAVLEAIKNVFIGILELIGIGL